MYTTKAQHTKTYGIQQEKWIERERAAIHRLNKKIDFNAIV